MTPPTKAVFHSPRPTFMRSSIRILGTLWPSTPRCWPRNSPRTSTKIAAVSTKSTLSPSKVRWWMLTEIRRRPSLDQTYGVIPGAGTKGQPPHQRLCPCCYGQTGHGGHQQLPRQNKRLEQTGAFQAHMVQLEAHIKAGQKGGVKWWIGFYEYQCIQKMCQILISSDKPGTIFTHCFLTLAWYLMERANNCVNSHVNNI